MEMLPGQPDWWLQRLTQRLLDRRARYDMLEDYYLGNHPFPIGDRRYRNALRHLQRKARTNYMALVADSPVERMQVNGFRFGKDDTSSDPEADRFWQANDMDSQSALVHLGSAIFGDTYVMVSPAPAGEDEPVISIEDPRTCITEQDPVRRRKARAGLRMWVDEEYETAIAIVYHREWVAYYTAPANLVQELGPLDSRTMTQRMFQDSRTWVMEDFRSNPYGAVPIERFAWRPTWTNDSRGEFENVIDVQDRINATILDRMIISRAQAYKQRWARGIKPEKDANGKAKPPFDPGSDILWLAPSENAEFGEFKEADIRQILDAVRSDVQDLAAITKTPPHYLVGEIVNASGDALKAAETGLVSKVKERMRSMGQSWEQVIKLCFLVQGDGSKFKTVDCETLWADPESRSRAELADAVLKESTIGVPYTLLMERLGYTPQQIERAKIERQQEQLRQTMQQIQQMQLMKSAGVGPDAQAEQNAKQQDGKPPAKGDGKQSNSKPSAHSTSKTPSDG